MKGDHKKFIPLMNKYLKPIGFKKVEKDNYMVTYKNKDGWIISLSANRYDDGFLHEIISPQSKHSYVVYLIVKIYNEQHNENIFFTSPSGWLEFIVQHKNWIFVEPQSYKKRYDELNAILE